MTNIASNGIKTFDAFFIYNGSNRLDRLDPMSYLKFWILGYSADRHKKQIFIV